MFKIFDRAVAMGNDPYDGIDLGDRVTDTLSSFTGVVTARCEYLTGCNQVHVLPLSDDHNEIKPGQWLDVERVEIVERGVVQIKPRATGADIPAPEMRQGPAGRMMIG